MHEHTATIMMRSVKGNIFVENVSPWCSWCLVVGAVACFKKSGKTIFSLLPAKKFFSFPCCLVRTEFSLHCVPVVSAVESLSKCKWPRRLKEDSRSEEDDVDQKII